jgi:integrase
MKYRPPGSRKGYPFIMITGRDIIPGRMIELRTGCRTKPEARAWFENWKKQRAAPSQAPGQAPPSAAPVAAPPPRDYRTFAEAVAEYARHPEHRVALGGLGRNAGERKIAWPFDQLIAALGTRPVGSIHRQDLIALAEERYPEGNPATKNRQILTPARAVLNFVAGLEPPWCGAPRIKKLRAAMPAPRALAAEDEIRLLAAAARLPPINPRAGRPPHPSAYAGEHHLLLLWLFRTGIRIGDTLRIQWEDPRARGERLGINLRGGVVRLVVGKTQRRHELPLTPQLLAALAKVPEDKRTGRLFHWSTQSSINVWLKPLCQTCGVHFTPHMARHTFGARLAAAKTPLSVMMEALTHASPSSTLVYIRLGPSETRTAITGLDRPDTDARSVA